MISIIMPVRNAIPFLDECLESITMQSGCQWELIAVDDHSTDDSANTLALYASRDSRISWFRNPGRGIIDALNKGYEYAEGEFITRMDADDRMTPGRLSVMKNQLVKHGKGHLAIGLVKYESIDSLGDGYQKYEHWLNELTRAGENFSEIYKECVIPSPCWMVHRTDFERCGAFHSNRYPEDYDLAFRFLEGGLKCIPGQEVLHIWRDHPNRASRNDDHYADQRFIELKVHWYVKLHLNLQRPLVVWGAGKKGKLITQQLLAHGISPVWVCNNEKKVGHSIYGVKLNDVSIVPNLIRPQIIIAVASPEAQLEIRNQLSGWKMINMKDFFFFC